jgi:hypothetical protein
VASAVIGPPGVVLPCETGAHGPQAPVALREAV